MATAFSFFMSFLGFLAVLTIIGGIALTPLGIIFWLIAGEEGKKKSLKAIKLGAILFLGGILTVALVLSTYKLTAQFLLTSEVSEEISTDTPSTEETTEEASTSSSLIDRNDTNQ